MSGLIERFGWMLVHSVWMGTAAWCALRLALAWMRNASAQTRYLVAGVALAFATLGPAGMFFRLDLGERVAATERVFTLEAELTATEMAPAANLVTMPPIPAALPPSFVQHADRVLAPWLSWICAAWLMGAVVSLARVVAGLRQVRALQRAVLDPLTADLQERLERLCVRLGVRVAVRAGASTLATVPTVVGWLKPVILLPPSAIAGLTPEQLEAVLAHELAHVVRHDFAVNLLQAVAEAVFFFHPAIHAINRHIRHERENACDDLAVAVTGDALAYARALAALEAERAASAPEPELVLAATGVSPPGDGELLLRVRRLVGLPRSSVARWRQVSWAVAAALTLYFGGMLALPAVAAWSLSTTERIREVASTLPESPTRRLSAFSEHDMMSASVELLRPDGSMHDGTVRVDWQTTRGNQRTVGRLAVNDGRGAAVMPVGMLHLTGWIPGYAPFVCGPFLPDATTRQIGPVRIRLEQGEPLTIRFEDEAGLPIAGVGACGAAENLRDDSTIHGFELWRAVSDEAGVIVVPAFQRGFLMRFDSERAGFAGESHRIALPEVNAPVVIRLSRVPAVIATVTSAETGRPIVGARLSIERTFDRRTGAMHGLAMSPGTAIATSDATGRFVLESMNPEFVVQWFVEAQGFAVGKLRWSGEPSVAIQLQEGSGWNVDRQSDPERAVPVRIRNAPADDIWLVCNFWMGNGADARARFEPEYRRPIVLIGPGSERSFRFEKPRGVTIAECRFELWTPPGVCRRYVVPYSAGAGASDVVLNFDEANALTRRFEESPESGRKRDVIVEFDTGFGEPAPAGLIGAGLETRNWRGVGTRGHTNRLFPVIGRELGLQFEPSNKYETTSWLNLRPQGLIGFWFEPREFEIPAGDDPLRVSLDLRPAGAIRGNFRAESPEQLRETRFDCVPLSGPARKTSHYPWIASDAENLVRRDGGFTITPVPFGGTYVVVARQGHNVSVSDLVHVDALHPLPTIEFSRRCGVTVAGRVIDEDGQGVPLRLISLSCELRPGTSFEAVTTTDAVGRFVLRDVNFEVPGNYVVETKHSALDLWHGWVQRPDEKRRTPNRWRGDSLPVTREIAAAGEIVLRIPRATAVR